MIDYTKAMDKNSIIATTNPLLLMFSVLCFSLLAYLCARKYRDTNDFKKSLILYLSLSPAVFIILLLLGLKFVFTVGTMAFGFIMLLLISNHYFYKE